MKTVSVQTVDGGVEIESDGARIFLAAADIERVRAALAECSPRARARKLAAERMQRYRASHNASRYASHDAKVKGPTDDHRAAAAKLGLDVEVEWAKYRDWQANVPTAKKHKNLVAGFNNWLRKAQEFKPRVDKHEAVSVAIWGDRAPSRQRLKTINEMFSDPPAVEGSYERLS